MGLARPFILSLFQFLAGMATLPDIRPNFSLFYKRDGSLPIPNNVTLVVDGVKLECSGLILAQRSETLRELLTSEPTIILDEFSGLIEQVKDCIQLLYGDKVKITLDNLQALMKFSIYYKIESMYQLCVGWIKENLMIEKFESFFKICFFVSLLEDHRSHALDLCRDIIMKGKPSDISQVLEGLVLIEDNQDDLMMFFLEPTFWELTLPMVTKWIDSNEKVDLVLKKIESNSSEFVNVGADFLSKLASSATVKETIVKINKYVIESVKQKERCIETLRGEATTMKSQVKRLETLKGEATTMKSQIKTLESQNTVAKNVVENALGLLKGCQENLYQEGLGVHEINNKYLVPAMKTLQGQFKTRPIVICLDLKEPH